MLLGAIQGFTLCIYLYPKRKANPLAFKFFVLFLFNLAFFNFTYAMLLLLGDTFSLPIPYEYLIGVGFFFYIKSNITDQGKVLFTPKEYLLFIPAILYHSFIKFHLYLLDWVHWFFKIYFIIQDIKA